MQTVVPIEIVIHDDGTEWQIIRTRHHGGWTAALTLLSESPVQKRHWYSSAMTSETIVDEPYQWIKDEAAKLAGRRRWAAKATA